MSPLFTGGQPRRRIFPGSRRAFSACTLVACACIGLAASAFAAEKKPAFHVEEASIASIQQAILSKQVTAVEIVKLYLTRIKAYNGQSVEMPDGLLGPIKTIPHAGQINALSTLNLRPATRKAWGFDDHKARSMTDLVDNDPSMPDALEVAAELDRQFAKTGKLVGPLHGVVFAIKDQYNSFDMRTTAGADAPYANDRPPHDATFLKRLRDAGAIILAKANLGEYAQAIPRSSFGGVFSNPYDTERSPGGSSSGSGSSVGANLVTCAIAEETGSSVRTPSRYNSLVGLAPTEELVSRYGMIQAGIQTRVGPIGRTAEDVARVLDVISGYDPHDELTAFNVGRKPKESYASFAHEKSLKGVRIGVVREYMDKSLFTKADEQSIDLAVAALDDLRKLGATIVDPGPGGALLTEYVRRYYPQLGNASFAVQNPELFPVDAAGKPTADQIPILLKLAADPTLVPEKITIRDLGAAQAVGESRYMMDRYLDDRGDANIKTLGDLVSKSNFYNDPHFGNRKRSLESEEKAHVLDMALRLQRRFAVQQIVLAAMADLNLDALTYPSGNIPPFKLGAPQEPTVNGRGGSWSFLGQQGFPAITVPAGFTTEVYDRVRDPSMPPVHAGGGFGGEEGAMEDGSRLVGPVSAKLPVGIDFVGRPFSEPTLFRIASAYQTATHHRVPPPDFGPVPGEP